MKSHLYELEKLQFGESVGSLMENSFNELPGPKENELFHQMF